MMDRYCDISVLNGKTMRRVERFGDDRIEFEVDDGEMFAMYHEQDCCESVEIEDICGDLSDLVGAPIVSAYESTSSDDPKDQRWTDSHTWTFYRISSAEGLVVIRWYGESNGYYSESADFQRVRDAAPTPAQGEKS